MIGHTMTTRRPRRARSSASEIGDGRELKGVVLINSSRSGVRHAATHTPVSGVRAGASSCELHQKAQAARKKGAGWGADRYTRR